MNPGFKKEELYKFKEAFNIFDIRQTGAINREDLASLLAILHISPLKSELEKVIAKHGTPEGKIRYKDYLAIITALKNRTDNREELTEAFEDIQDNPGETISVNRLREILTSKGEPFSNDEFELFVQEADPRRTGQIQYKEFIKMLLK